MRYISRFAYGAIKFARFKFQVANPRVPLRKHSNSGLRLGWWDAYSTYRYQTLHQPRMVAASQNIISMFGGCRWLLGCTGRLSVYFPKNNCNKSLWKNIFLVSLHSCTSPLVCAPPQLSLSLSRTICRLYDYQRFIFGNSNLYDRFTGNPKKYINIYIYIFPHLPIYEVNVTARYLPRQRKYPYEAIYKQRVLT